MNSQPHDWEIIASRDPFFGVLASCEYRIGEMDAAAKERFYASGAGEIATVLSWFDADLGARPLGGTALDIGCGVGRLSYAMARHIPQVVGYDVATSMLKIAREAAPANARFVSELPGGPFCWINSFIVFQHIPPAEGLELLGLALDRAGPGAFASIQITGWNDQSSPQTVLARIRRWRSLRRHRKSGRNVHGLIQMHAYSFSDVARLFSARGFRRLVLRHTDHGGHHGAWIIARKS